MASKGKKNAKTAEPPPKPAAPKGKLFGQPLGNDVPKIITASLAHLRETGALLYDRFNFAFLFPFWILRGAAMTEEGLFRISGQQEEVTLLREKWDSGAPMYH